MQFPNVSKKEMEQYLKKNEKKHLRDRKHNIFFFAVVNNEKIGYVHGEIKKGEGHFERIFIKKEYRGKGIAQQLFKKLEKEFKQRKIKEIWSNHFYDNLPSKKLHEALGFKPDSIEYRKKI